MFIPIFIAENGLINQSVNQSINQPTSQYHIQQWSIATTFDERNLALLSIEL